MHDLFAPLFAALPIPPSAAIRIERVAGGSISESYRVDWTGGSFFCKVNSATNFPHLFRSEMDSLRFLAAEDLPVPGVLCCLEQGPHQWLALEWITPGRQTPAFWWSAGEALARFHQQPGPYFGSETSNYMGAVPQSNRPEKDWSTFFIQQRLQPLVARCFDLDLLDRQLVQEFDRLYAGLGEVFDASLAPYPVHGDLWSGNLLCTADGSPVFIDPAAYYGVPAVDLGMSTLFGSFDNAFYEGYEAVRPGGCRNRESWPLCNLYPLLVHLLLFGASYLPAIRRTLALYR
jgi:protein-ribulosamine 3-kinase